MARATGFFDEEFFTGDDGIHIAAGRTGEPRGVVRRLHDGDPTAHHGVVRAAILRAKEMIAASFGGAKPHGVVVARDDVHFDAESGDVEIVNDVFAGEDELDVAADGNVKLIDFTAAIGLLNLPHPLLADDVEVEGGDSPRR